MHKELQKLEILHKTKYWRISAGQAVCAETGEAVSDETGEVAPCLVNVFCTGLEFPGSDVDMNTDLFPHLILQFWNLPVTGKANIYWRSLIVLQNMVVSPLMNR